MYSRKDYGRLPPPSAAKPLAVVMSRPEAMRQVRLQRPHVSSLCVGTCSEATAPCRQLMQLPPLTQAARDLLLRVGDDKAPAVESDYYRNRRLASRR